MEELFDLYVDFDGFQNVYEINICPHKFSINLPQDRFKQSEGCTWEFTLRHIVKHTYHLQKADKDIIINNTYFTDGTMKNNINVFEIAIELCPDELIN